MFSSSRGEKSCEWISRARMSRKQVQEHDLTVVFESWSQAAAGRPFSAIIRTKRRENKKQTWRTRGSNTNSHTVFLFCCSSTWLSPPIIFSPAKLGETRSSNNLRREAQQTFSRSLVSLRESVQERRGNRCTASDFNVTFSCFPHPLQKVRRRLNRSIIFIFYVNNSLLHMCLK